MAGEPRRVKWRQKAAEFLGLGQWASRQDLDNFRTNRVTLAEYDDRLSGSTALSLSATWACINLIAGTISSLPLMVYRTVNDEREVARDHPLYRLLHDTPNYDQTAVDFLEFISASVELQGNAYAEKKLTSTGRIVAIVPIRPDLVTVSRTSGGKLLYVWTENGTRNEVIEDRMLHIRGFGGGPLGGASTLSSCASTFAGAMSVERAATGMFRNGARPSGVLSIDKPLTGPQRTEVERLLQEKFVGAMNDGRPMVLDNGLQWQQLTMKSTDAEMLESRKFSVEEIARIFGVPPHMIGHTGNSTSWGSGLEQQTLGFQKFTLRRRLKRIEQAMEKQLLTVQDRLAGITIEFNLEGLLRGDSGARSAFYQSALNNGWMTINEVRALENMPAVDGGNVPRMQMQNVPITEAGQQPAGVAA
jgi:HK97 family phage portal protein